MGFKNWQDILDVTNKAKVLLILKQVIFEPPYDKCVMFSTISDTNRAVQTQKMVGVLKFRIQEVDGLYYLCSENKGIDQLHGYCAADLRICFRICKKHVFSLPGSY